MYRRIMRQPFQKVWIAVHPFFEGCGVGLRLCEFFQNRHGGSLGGGVDWLDACIIYETRGDGKL